jgi:hypothetical protein
MAQPVMTPFTKYSELMDDLAQIWALPIATGYLPPRYIDHVAGCRLMRRSQSIPSRACDPSASVMPSDDSWPRASLPAARRRSPVCSKTHTPGLFTLEQTSRMGQHTCFTSLLVFFIARQNVLTMMTPLLSDCFPRRQKRLQYFVPSSSCETSTAKSTISC